MSASSYLYITVNTGAEDDNVSVLYTGGTSYLKINTGSGNDTINYAYGNDVIKFNDVKITDITYGEFDLNTN